MKKIILVVCFLLICSSTHCFSEDNVNYNVYFDAATGHKYVKLDSFTYAEFSKTGRFLKNVPSNLPLLLSSSKIYPIPKNSYILYEKTFYGVSDHKVLSENTDHPKGWKAKKILVSLN